jgi:hypothetical protein
MEQKRDYSVNYIQKCISASAFVALGLAMAGCQQAPPAPTVVETPAPAAATPAPTPAATPAPVTSESSTTTRSSDVKQSDQNYPDGASSSSSSETTKTMKKTQ